MANKLTNLKIKEVSLVKKGAIREKFTVIKSEDDEDLVIKNQDIKNIEQNQNLISAISKSVIEAIKKAGDIFKTNINKAVTTFATLITPENEIRNTFWNYLYILEDSFYYIIWDENLTSQEKCDYIIQSIREFADFLNTKFNQIQKSENVFNEFLQKIEKEEIQKIGRKISAARLAKIENVIADLASIVAEAKSENINKNKEGDDNMPSLEEITKAMESIFEKQIKPLQDQIFEISKRVDDVQKTRESQNDENKNNEINKENQNKNDNVNKEDKEKFDITSFQKSMEEVIKKQFEPIQTQIQSLDERVKKMETSDPGSASIPPGPAAVEKCSGKKWPSFRVGKNNN